MRYAWKDEGEAKTLRSQLMGRLMARVNWTGSLWRGTVWTNKGTSSATENYLAEAMDWCEYELGL